MDTLWSWFWGPTSPGAGKFFGQPLDHPTAKHSVIPPFIVKAVAFLDENSTVEFLFRSPGSKADLDVLVQKVDTGDEVDFSAYKSNPHVVADLIKRYLRSLPESLIPASYVGKFVEVVQQPEHHLGYWDLKLEDLIESLPRPHTALLEFILAMAKRLTLHSNSNKMDAASLAVVLTPMIFNDSAHAGLGMEEIKALISSERKVVQVLIDRHDTVFRAKFHPMSNSLAMPPKFSLKMVQNTVAQQSTKGVNILALDGGGMRGVIEIKILSMLAEEMFGDSEEHGTRLLLSKFDLIGGTSTGGIISLALLKKSLSQVRQFYYAMGSQIFQSSWFYDVGRWFRYYRSGDYYDGVTLEKLFLKYFGEGLLSEYHTGQPHVFLAATDATDSIWQPFVFRSYSNQLCLVDGMHKAPTVTALRATSAAPMYFSQVALDGHLFVDGGLVANNPTELAIFEAHHMFEDANIDCILSIGTGVPGKAAGSVNIFRMLSEIIDICTSSNSIHERVAEWIHMMPEPRPNYFRLNPTGGVGSLPLDTSDPKVLENVEKATEEYMKTPAAREMIDRIKSILSKRPSAEPKEQAPIHASRLDNSV